MAGVAGYVRRHHLGLLALFIALGGTGYAAVHSARATPTIHACASKKTGALTLARAHDRCRHGQRKVNWAVKGPRGAAGRNGSAGASGRTGVTGATGVTGITGTTGLTGTTGPAGPTAAGFATGVADPNPPSDATLLTPAATVTTTTSSKILVQGSVDLVATCSGPLCDEEYGMYVDGKPVAGSLYSVLMGTGATTQHVSSSGLTGTLAAGAHTVQIGASGSGTFQAGSPQSEFPRVSGIAIGG